MPKKSRSTVYKRCQIIIHSATEGRKCLETTALDGHLVLIIEDDDMVRRCLARLIQARGYIVEAYSSAEEFLLAKQVNESVCLLLDATLPGMSGLELQHRLADENCRLPIIFMTAHDESNVREQALHYGAIAFLCKPFNADALWGALESVSKVSNKLTNDDDARSLAEHLELGEGGHHASRQVEHAKK
jgi:FixJ family two-component response regulator